MPTYIFNTMNTIATEADTEQEARERIYDGIYETRDSHDMILVEVEQWTRLTARNAQKLPRTMTLTIALIVQFAKNVFMY